MTHFSVRNLTNVGYCLVACGREDLAHTICQFLVLIYCLVFSHYLNHEIIQKTLVDLGADSLELGIQLRMLSTCRVGDCGFAN